MKTLISVVILFFSLSGFSQCGNDKNVLFFANGMFNSQKDANISLNKIVEKYSKTYSNSDFDDYQVAYNTNEFVLLQVYQVYRQKIEETGLGFWKWLGRFNGLENNDIFKEKLQEYYSEQRAHDQDLKVQLNKYQNYLKNGFKIITVAHSQGNFYTNFSFEQLNSQQTKMISVATPANHVHNKGPYYTFKSDHVIAYIPSSLIPNREKKNPGYFDHKFVDDYLNDETVGNEILSAVKESLIKNYTPDPSLKIEDAYYHANMAPVLNWFNVAVDKNIQAKPADCVVAYALFNVHKLQNLNCEERNLEKFKTSIHDCILDLQDTSNKRKETACPFYYGMEVGHAYEALYPGERYTFFHNNPFCEINSMDEYKKKINLNDLQTALSHFN